LLFLSPQLLPHIDQPLRHRRLRLIHSPRDAKHA